MATWLVDETKAVRTDVDAATGESNYAFDELPTINVTKPDGTSIDPDPTVTSDPAFGTSAATHRLLAYVTAAQGGEYTMDWEWDIGSQDPRKRKETYFAYWTDVYGLLRSKALLNKTETELSDADIDREFARAVRLLGETWTDLAVYNSLAAADRPYVDEGLAFLIAAKLHTTMGWGSADVSGAQSIRQGPVTIQYGGYGIRSQAGAKSAVDQWMAEGMRLLGRVEAIKDAISGRANNFRPFIVSGPSRRIRTQTGALPSLRSWAEGLIVSDWDAMGLVR